jgi:hypothetical protein
MKRRLTWLASYPKSGNTWLRLVLTNLRNEGTTPATIHEIDTDGMAGSRRWLDRVLGFSTGDLYPDELAELRPSVYRWENAHAEDALYLKCHDACTRTPSGGWLLAPEVARVVYLLRNPLDVAVSLAHHNAAPLDTVIAQMGQDDFVLPRQTGKGLTWQVGQTLLSWSAHVESWVDNPAAPACVLRYEDMVKDPEESFGRVARFLDLPDDARTLHRAIEHASFDRLQAQERAAPFRERSHRASHFFRKGIVGDWQSALSARQIDRIVADHAVVMRRFGYLDAAGAPQTA